MYYIFNFIIKIDSNLIEVPIEVLKYIPLNTLGTYYMYLFKLVKIIVCKNKPRSSKL